MSQASAVYLCGGDLRPGPRIEECPNTLHDWPLPSGYVNAHEVADRRLRTRWSNRACPDCGKYGWTPGTIREGQDVFATRDGSALNWRGVVYVRAEPLTSVDPLDIV